MDGFGFSIRKLLATERGVLISGVSVITVLEAWILVWDLFVTVCCCRRASKITRQSGPISNEDDIDIEGPFFVIENGTKETIA